jgi:hypothetical protein
MVFDKPHILLSPLTFLEMTATFIKMSSVLFETEQYVARLTVSFQHLTGYIEHIEQIARFIISSVLYGSQDVLEISGSLWNLDRFM